MAVIVITDPSELDSTFAAPARRGILFAVAAVETPAAVTVASAPVSSPSPTMVAPTAIAPRGLDVLSSPEPDLGYDLTIDPEDETTGASVPAPATWIDHRDSGEFRRAREAAIQARRERAARRRTA